RFLTGLAGAAVHAVLLAALGLAIAALTRVRAFAIVAIVGAYLVTSSVVAILLGVGRDTVVARVAGLFTPFQLLDWFQVWAFGARPVVQPGPGDAGPVYGLVTAALAAGLVGLLVLRYRRAQA